MSAAEILALLAAFEGVLIAVLATYIWQERRDARRLAGELEQTWCGLSRLLDDINKLPEPQGEKL